MIGKMAEKQRETGPEKVAITTGSWVRGIVVIAIAVALFLIHKLLLILLVCIVIASSIEPAAYWAKKRNIPRLPVIIFIYIFSAVILAGLFYFLFLPLLGEFSGFLHSLPDYSASLASSPVFNNVSGTISIDDVIQQVNSLLSSLSTGVFSSAAKAFGGIFSFVLIVVLSFYLSVQDDGVGKFLRIITPFPQEKYVVGLWQRSRRKIGLWMQGQLLLSLFIAVLVYLGLLLVGLPHALLLAVAAGVLEIIPVFGPILAAIPCVVIGFSSGGMSLALVTGGLFLVIQQFENHLIYPLVVKKVVGVPPIISIIALLIGAELGGFLGIVVSVPMAAVFMEFISDLEKKKVEREQTA
jgi:predicted PurR-regulated permease PerM